MFFKSTPVIDSYCEHLSKGFPSKAWVYEEANICIENLRNHVYIPDFEDQILSARAKGVMVRFERFMSIMNEVDAKAASGKINALKAIEEVFFAEASQDIDSQESLYNTISNLTKEEPPNESMHQIY